MSGIKKCQVQEYSIFDRCIRLLAKAGHKDLAYALAAASGYEDMLIF